MRSFAYWPKREIACQLLSKGKRCAEIGVFRGGFSDHVLAANPSSLVLVDPWKSQSKEIYPNDSANVDNQTFEKYYQEIVSRFGKDKRVTIARDFSENVAKIFPDESFDVVYLDAIHTSEAVLADALAWYPKVKKGGWLWGHDISGKHGENVNRGVENFAAAHKIPCLDATTHEEYGSWAIRKRGVPKIPKILHQVWLGSQIPDNLVAQMKTWQLHHPDWERWLWTDRDTKVEGWETKSINSLKMINEEIYNNLKIFARKSNVARLEIIYKFGGIYTDSDYDCQKNIEYAIDGLEAFGTKYTTTFDPSIIPQPGVENELCNAMFGAVVGHPWIRESIRLTPEFATDKIAFGSRTIYKASKVFPEVVHFEPWAFSPYRWNEPEKKDLDYPDAWAIHRWAKNW